VFLKGIQFTRHPENARHVGLLHGDCTTSEAPIWPRWETKAFGARCRSRSIHIHMELVDATGR
jgi:hypothetical protein